MTTINGTGVSQLRPVRARQRRAGEDETKELSETEPKKLVITLGTEAAEATRGMAETMGTSAPEAVRRGLTLLNLVLTAKERGEKLALYDPATKQAQELVFAWDYQ